MENRKLVAIVGLGAILPDAFDVTTFWQNILSARYSIGDVPADRWSVDRYYDPDPAAVDKSYTKIGAFVRGYQFDPLKNGIAIPPKVLATMDIAQQWAIAASQQALKDYGYPERKLDPERVAIIFGNTNAGEGHYRSTFRILVPDYINALSSVPEFQYLPEAVRRAIVDGAVEKVRSEIPAITEDTMPGELSNIIAGRVANVFNFSGPNYVTDAACASSLAALQGAVNGLLDRKFDAALSGAIDRSMGPESYIKFCKIGALSADGSRPYADGANGFVMGEGAVVFLLKRLEDAEQNGDRIYAVIRGIGGSSDGKGKGITAPNPLGQQRAIERAWHDAGITPGSAGLIEGHGTSTRVGDVTEVNSLAAVFAPLGLKPGSVVLGSVKSNLGHLKSAAGAVGLLKTILALHHRVLPPTANFERPNPNIDFASTPFEVIREPREWEIKNGGFRFAGTSSFGFGGTNFHLVMEEYVPGVGGSAAPAFTVPEAIPARPASPPVEPSTVPVPALVVATVPAAGGEAIKAHVVGVVSEKTGYPQEMLDLDLDLEADLGIDTVKQAELFAAIRTHYGIPRREDLRLSDYNTLAKVIGFVQENLGTGASVPVAATAEATATAPAAAPEPTGAPAEAPSGGTVAGETPQPGATGMDGTPAAAGGARPDGEAIKVHVLGVVSEKTGYPQEMLDLDLDLEADLGIDTVKQAELFAAIRTHYGIPRREDLRLSDYNTLGKVIGFVAENLGTVASVPVAATVQVAESPAIGPGESGVIPYQGLFFASAQSAADLKILVQARLEEVRLGRIPASVCPTEEEIRLPERIAIDYANPEELVKRLERAVAALEQGNADTWKALQAHAIYRGSGVPGKVAFLFPGQGSQYVNMFLDLRDTEPVVRATFDEADRVMTPILGRPLTSYIYTNGTEEELKQAEKELKNTAITQPAMLTADVVVARMLKKFGVEPDLVIGHSLGEYAALVAAGVLTFAEALEVVSARGREMSRLKVEDPGCMAAISAPLERVEEVIAAIDDYVVIANINSPVQCVLGGTTKAIDAAIARFVADGFQAVKIPVSHAFHTRIVAPASEPLRKVIERMDLRPPRLPIVANVTGDLYPSDREEILDLLASQVASPVQFVKGMQTLYAEGARIFIECGPKRVLNALATDNLKSRQDVTILSSNHPRKGGRASFNEALCGIYAAGLPLKGHVSVSAPFTISSSQPVTIAPHVEQPNPQPRLVPITGSVVVTGVGLGLPGRSRHVFDDSNFERILDGEMRIEPLDENLKKKILEKHVNRLVKSSAGAVMQEVVDMDQVVQLGGQGGEFDLVEEFGVPEDRVDALDLSSQLGIAAGMEALRDAGIPLVMARRKTTKGTYLPDRWKLPETMQDETGVIFASSFPGLNRMAEEADQYYATKMLENQLLDVQSTIELVNSLNPTGQSQLLDELERRRFEIQRRIREADYHLDRRFVFRVLVMGHSQFAEYIGARGPNTHVNAACASTTHAVSVAEDWIRSGRCRRVIVIAGDDITNANLISWIGSSMFASGAATIEEDLRLAILPFDRRRNGMIMGMGGAALVIESEDAARERGVRAIAEILSTATANSAFHGTRMDVQHVSEVMERLLQMAEQRFAISRQNIAPQTVFMSHETYTPARGGSASAEIYSLRQTFHEFANQVIIANTKGFTGHPMGAGIEDVVVLKALETGKVPPIAHIHDGFEPDPDLGDLNLSKGGVYNPQYALRLGAGFGSQIAMSLMRRVPGVEERIDRQKNQQWLAAVTGYDNPELEVVQRTLRVKTQGTPVHEPVRTTWQYGQGPSLWAPAAGSEPVSAVREAGASPVTPALNMEPLTEQPAPAAEVVSPVTVAAVPAAGGEAIKAHVLGVVSEKTGYPQEMLDLDLDLEADLGVDTVKQAELFAAIRTHYGIPRREDLRLSDYNTLAKVIGFVQENLGTGASVPAAATAEATATAPAAAPEPTGAPAEAPSGGPVAGETPQPAATGMDGTPAAAGGARPDGEAIKVHVLGVVSEKTGYPQEMLDLDLDLEADLGIDTVKQAELFAAIRTHYGIPRREDLRLSDYNTLGKVIGFVQENLGTAASVPAAATVEKMETKVEPANTEAPAPGETPGPADMESQIADTIRQEMVEESLMQLQPQTMERPPVKRRMPVPVLFPKPDLCLPTGVNLENRTVIVVGDKGKVGASLLETLRSRRAQAELVDGLAAPSRVEELAKTDSLAGVYFLPALDADPEWTQLDHSVWLQARSERIEPLYHIARALPASAFLLCATRMGGLHGLQNPTNSLGGLISGFTKALRRERQGQLAKVVDFEGVASPQEIAGQLIDETLADSSSVEIGYEGGLRFGVALREAVTPETTRAPLGRGSVFVISGGTGGITGPVVADLARETQGTFYLLGRSALPPRGDADLQSLRKDKDAFKAELFRRLSEAGEKPTPLQVEQKVAAFERASAAVELMAAVEAAGGRAFHLVCDVTDAQAVQTAVTEIASREKQVDVFIHAAGFERSRKIENKPLEEFRDEISVKADGFYNLFRCLEKENRLPKAVVFFSSVAGRFGNSGQTAYSAANDLLSKLSFWLPRQYPGLKTISIDWGAWAEVGMASRGNIPRLMELAGIDMLCPDLAAPMVRGELELGTCGEVVIAGSLGALEEISADNCGLDIQKANLALRAGDPIHKMFSNLAGFHAATGIRLEADLDPETTTYLRDHAINGIPVLPGVMGIEGFTVAAKHIASVLASGTGNFDVERLENINFLAPFKFYGNKPRTIQWNAVAVRRAKGLMVEVSLESDFRRHNGDLDHILHFTGEVFLTTRGRGKASEVFAIPPQWSNERSVLAEDIYKLYFHGPSFQVLDAAQVSGATLLGRLNKKLIDSSDQSGHSYTTPLLIELCFQTAGLWEAGATGVLSLPQRVGRLQLYRQPVNGVPIFAEVRSNNYDGRYSFNARVVDAKGRVFLELTDYQTSPLPYQAEKDLIEPLKTLVPAGANTNN